MIADRTRDLALGLIVLGAVGCSSLLQSPHDADIKKTMARAEYLAARGDYDHAISEYEKTIDGPSKNPWREKVLFELGCLYASNENPGRDYARSLFYFRKLNEEFPKSRFQAGIPAWLGLLETVVSLETELQAVQAELAENRREIEKLEAERLEREASSAAEINLKARRLKELENLVQNQKAALESLQQQMKRMKDIDIQSEKKAKGIK
jgi:tetratricopeptide (TPR) repeat protein